MKKSAVLFGLLFVTECFGVEWVNSRDEAIFQANSECKRILLLAGRETCGNCRYMKYTVMETPEVSGVLEDHFVCWFCDVDSSTEWHSYAEGLGSFYLPLICVIDTEDPSAYLARSTGVVYTDAFSQWIDPYVISCLQNNLVGFAEIAQSWRAVYGDDNYNEICDMDNNDVIDIGDLLLFCETWLE